MPLQATSGAASYDAFGGGVAAVPNYIEDVFSTWLYTGNGSTQTITNGIDLAGKGGMVWVKRRDTTSDNILTVAGNGLNLSSNSTTDFINDGQPLFNSSGFNLISANATYNASGGTYASWTFREQAKFFDVVTYTGNGANRTIAHNLGSEPGCIIIKSTNRNSTDWAVYHRSLGNTQYIRLNTTGAATTSSTAWNNTTPTSTVFSLGTNADVNNSGGANYVAYLFAHNAGGFGLSGTDNVISCGSFTTDGSSNFSVNLGYEPQWILAKQATGAANNWAIFDNMRGMSNTDVARLIPNSSAGESNFASPFCVPTATGFFSNSGGFFDASQTVIYIAIRRGPMKVPTTGTSVYFPQAYADGSLGSANPINLGASAGFPVDMFMHSMRQETTFCSNIFDRLRGSNPALITSGTNAESTGEPLNAFENAFDVMSGIKSRSNNRFYFASAIGRNHIAWNFQRAPGFFDVVCYTGDGSGTRAINHNLGVIPTLMISKTRSAAGQWIVYNDQLTFEKYLILNSTAAADTLSAFWGAAPTASTFSVGAFRNDGGPPAEPYVVYLFATCPGVSKVGSYTGTGTTQTINCGFTGGARFVLIKSTSTTGDWYVWDTARGMIPANDPYLRLNSTAAEVTGTDWVDTAATGFELSNAGGNLANSSGVSYIFWAVA